MQTRWNDHRFTQDLESLVSTAAPVVRRYLHILATGDAKPDFYVYVGSRAGIRSRQAALTSRASGAR